MAKREVTIEKNGYRCVFCNAEDRSVDVVVHHPNGGKTEMTYPKLRGYCSLDSAADLWADQAILEARAAE